MNLVDSSGWLEYFDNGANAYFFASAIEDLDSLIVPTICQYEVFRRLLVKPGEAIALEAVGFMSLAIIADVTRDIAVAAASISVEQKLAMADSIILATALAYEATLWTQDADFAGITGVQYVAK
jgi:predicted nucleic acid-binding protein